MVTGQMVQELVQVIEGGHFMKTGDDQMPRTLRNLLLTVSLLLVLFVGSSFISTATQLAAAADRLHDGAGQWVFYAIVGLMAILLAYAAALYLRFPPALIPPVETSGPEYERYQNRLLQHLNKIRASSGSSPISLEEVSGEFERLAGEAHQIIRDRASSVFVSTAVLQNGRLDGLIVLGTQLQLVWQIAKVYQLRPSPRQMAYLYGNVSINALAAQGLDDVDFAELSAPIMTAVIPSLKGAIPGLQGLASLLANSLSSGAANAMLTLRIGSIAQQYCALQPGMSKSTIRPKATRFAVSQIGLIVKEKGASVAVAAFDAIAVSVADAVGNTKDAVQQAMTNVSDGILQIGSRTADTAKEAAQGVMSAVGRGGDTVSDIAAKFKDGAIPVASATFQAIGSSAKTAKDTAVVVATGVKDGTATGVTWVGDAVLTAGQKAMTLSGQAADTSVNLAKGLVESTGEGVRSIKNSVFGAKPESSDIKVPCATDSKNR